MKKEDFSKASEIKKKLDFLEKVQRMLDNGYVIMVGSLRLDKDMDFHCYVKAEIYKSIGYTRAELNAEFEKI